MEESVPVEPLISLSGAVLAATDRAPFLIAGLIRQTGELPFAATWTSSDGVNWVERVVEGPDSPAGLLFDGSGSLAAIVAYEWHDGRRANSMWVSEDRRTWHEVALPNEAATASPTGITVIDDIAYLFLQDDDGAAAAVRVEDNVVTTFELPTVEDGARLRPRTIALMSEQVVLIAQPGPDSAELAISSYVLTHGEWSPPSRIEDTTARVDGIITVGDTIVATGGNFDESAHAYRAAAWHTVDGVSWQSEVVGTASRDSDFRSSEGRDISLGAPSATGDTVVAVAENAGSVMSALYRRDSAGVWSLDAGSPPNEGYGLGGVAALATDGTIVAVVKAPGFARLATIEGNAWTNRTDLSERQDLYSAQFQAGSTPTVVMIRSDWDRAGYRWRSSVESRFLRASGDELSRLDAPPGAERFILSYRAQEGEETVVVGQEWPDKSDDLVTRPWLLTAAGDWVEGEGLEQSSLYTMAGLRKIEGTWYLFGQATPNISSSSHHGAVFSSTDGVHWRSESGDFGALDDLTTTSRVADVCLTPTGVAAVGWAEGANARRHPAIWTRSDGVWRNTAVGALSERMGSLTTCAAASDGDVLVQGNLDEHASIVAWDGNNVGVVYEAKRGEDMGAAIALGDGFAAPGSFDRDGFDVPVIWFSGDAKHWTPLFISSWGPGSVSDIAVDGDDLLVAMSGWIGEPLSRLEKATQYIPRG